MVVVVGDLVEYVGTVTPTALSAEATVVSFGPETGAYIVEGYLSLSSLATGDTVVVTEYVGVDGVNFEKFLSVVFDSVQDVPVIRFHSKTLPKNCLYKVTVKQVGGTLRSFAYAFIKEVLSTA